VKGTIHWVSARHAVPAEVRLYDRLFAVPDPDNDEGGKTYKDHLNPHSRRSVRGYVEPAAANAQPEQSFQFERLGYFVADRYEHRGRRAGVQPQRDLARRLDGVASSTRRKPASTSSAAREERSQWAPASAGATSGCGPACPRALG